MQHIRSDRSFFYSSLSYAGYDVVVSDDKMSYYIDTPTGRCTYFFNENNTLDRVEVTPQKLANGDAESLRN